MGSNLGYYTFLHSLYGVQACDPCTALSFVEFRLLEIEFQSEFIFLD